MRPRDLKYLTIDTVGDFITNVDPSSQKDNYMLEVSGFRNEKEGIGERDFGTVGKWATIPISPNAKVMIVPPASVLNLTPIQIYKPGHGLTTGNIIWVSEVQGCTAANGRWTVTGIDANYFSLAGSIGNGTYTGGGVYSTTPIDIVDGCNFIDPDTGTEYPIIVGRDSSNNLRVYVLSSANSWTELTEKVGCKVNGTPTQDVWIDTITDGLGASFAPLADYFNGWIAVNANGTVAFIIDYAVWMMTLNYNPNWSDNDNLSLYRSTGVWNGGGSDKYVFATTVPGHTQLQSNEVQKKCNLLYGNSIYSADAHSPIQITKRSATEFFPGTVLSGGEIVAATAGQYHGPVTFPAGWYAEKQQLIPYFASLGSAGTPLRPSDELRSGQASVTAGSTHVSGSGTDFLTEFEVGQYIKLWVDAGYAESRVITYIHSPVFLYVDKAFGTTETGYLWRGRTPGPQPITDSDGNTWMTITPYITDEVESVESGSGNTRFLVTVMYDGIQESDPIFQFFAAGCSGLDRFPDVNFVFGVEFAKMNKRISGVCIYAALSWEKDIPHKDWLDISSEYKKVADISFRTWSSTTGRQQGRGTPGTSEMEKYFVSSPGLDKDYIISNSGVSILDNLGHAIDKNRSNFNPRFATKSTKSFGSVVVCDEDDKVLRVSSYDGAGVHEDDNFPDVAVDNNGGLQKVILNSVGELLGLATMDDVVYALKRNSIESIDLQSGIQKVISADVLSPKSIIACAHGLAWAGDSEIGFIPAGGGGKITLNTPWLNYYDGSLKYSGATGYIEHGDRAVIISGYDPLYDELVFIISTQESRRLAFRYSFRTKKWSIRKFAFLNSSPWAYSHNAVFLDRTVDNHLLIGYSHGLVEYPNKVGPLRFEDDVLIDGAGGQHSQAGNIETLIKIGLGEVYSMIKNVQLYDIYVDWSGSSVNGTENFDLNLYSNFEDNPFDSKTVPIDKPHLPRKMTPRGQVENFQIGLSLPVGAEHNFLDWELYQIQVGHTEHGRTGNR